MSSNSRRKGTVCVYDIKTGKSGLTQARVAEIAREVHRAYNNPLPQRIIITEVRPFQVPGLNPTYFSCYKNKQISE
jgi:hypothetical protein